MRKNQKTKKTFRKGLTNVEGCDIIHAVRSVGFENKQTPSRHTTRVRMVHNFPLSKSGDFDAYRGGFCVHFFIFGGIQPLARTAKNCRLTKKLRSLRSV